jgi:hypothetical protein
MECRGAGGTHHLEVAVLRSGFIRPCALGLPRKQRICSFVTSQPSREQKGCGDAYMCRVRRSSGYCEAQPESGEVQCGSLTTGAALLSKGAAELNRVRRSSIVSSRGAQ